MANDKDVACGVNGVKRFASTTSANHFPEQAGRHIGQSALNLIDRVATVINSTESCTEATLRRAIDCLKAAEERIRTMEVQALNAESRAYEAQNWLMRLRDALQERLAAGRIDSAGAQVRELSATQ